MNIPKIRFKGFTDDWVQRKLGEVAEFSSSKRIHVSDYVPTGIPFYRGSEVSTGGVSRDSELYISENLYDEIKEKYGVPAKGDLLITAVGTLGNVWKIDDRRFYYKDGNLILLSNLKACSDYLIAYLADGRGKKKVLDSAAGSNQKALTMVKLNEIELFIPSLPEQTRIGTFFRTLDDTITLYQRKLDGLKKLKAGYLQQMFPQAGETIPRVRFAGFSGEWVVRKLGEVADCFDNLRIPVAAVERKNGNIPYYGANGIQDYIEGFTHEGEFILIAEDGANDLVNYPVQYAYGRIWVNNHAHVLQGKDNILDNKFLMVRFQSSNISNYLVGSGRAKLNAGAMIGIEFLYPSYLEQTAIGNFFRNLDEQITAQKQKIEQLKRLKLGYLQKMFV